MTGVALDLNGIKARLEEALKHDGGKYRFFAPAFDLILLVNKDFPALVAEVERLRAALTAAIPVLDFVSRGRGYIGCDIYPDATARRALAMANAALSADAERADTTEAQL